jgi:Zn-dependent protease
MNDPLVAALITVVVMLLVGFPVHEFMHAWTAYRLGDNTARWQGRVTLDPRVHFDTFGGLVLAFTAVTSALIPGGGLLFGWAKPTPVNPMNIANGRRGEALVSFAGPFSNLVIAFIVAVPMRLVLSSPELSRTVLFESEILGLIFDVGVLLLTLNILLFVFNLIPVPPLDGWRVLMGIVPSDVAYRMRELELRYANVIPMIFMGVIFIMLFSGATFLGQIIRFIRDLLLGI